MNATDLERGWLPNGAGCRYGCGGKVRHNDSCVYAEWRTNHGFVHPYRDGACGLHGTLYCSICTRRAEECIHGACREYASHGDYCESHVPLERRYDLKLADGRTVSWVGRDGEDASRRYVDCHRDAAVVAWREPRTYVGPVHHSQIIG